MTTVMMKVTLKIMLRERRKMTRGAAFLWTADDEKNVMDLGYSEMERNHRLELLMARRVGDRDL
jgi:hypothetical protein